jgi:hypothetical protein
MWLVAVSRALSSKLDMRNLKHMHSCERVSTHLLDVDHAEGPDVRHHGLRVLCEWNLWAGSNIGVRVRESLSPYNPCDKTDKR